MIATGEFKTERRELATILASGIFDRSPGLAQLLSYVCEKHFAGEGEKLKEYSIAVDALGRPAGFDPKHDSIIRVQFHRLRDKLTAYYASGGADHPVRIVIPQGQYAPKFIIPERLRVASPADARVEAGGTLEVATDVTRPADSEPVSTGLLSLARSWVWVLAAGLACVAAVGAYELISLRPAKEPPREAASAAPVLPLTDSVRILAGLQGNNFTDGNGSVWLTDRYFRGGTAVALPNQAIWGTRDPRIYRSRRQGDFHYDIPLRPGIYELRLHFAETYFGEMNSAGFGGESTRTFGVSANNQPLISRLDVAGEAGINVARVKVYRDISPAADGMLHLGFERGKDQPFINAIEITPGTPGKLLPIRLIAQARGYTDPMGRRWEPDRLAVGGQVVAREAEVGGAADPQIFAGERFGNISYTIPVAPGKYTVVLHLAERRQSSGGGATGYRLFDIRCNGVALARAFDIAARAEGMDRALVQRFEGIEPSRQGDIVLSLAPVKNFALINALEVLDESK